MTIDDNIFELYSQLPNDGGKQLAKNYIADICGVTVFSSTQWIKNKQLPKYLEDGKKYKIIAYMQKAIALNNELKTQ